jgi:predicted AAA+ superfamily ATPase
MIIIHAVNSDALPRLRGRRINAYWADTGLALHLSGAKPDGPHLENLVLSDLLAWRETRREATEILYWRTATGDEVDFVIETEGRVVPIEIKASARPTTRDIRGLQVFRDEYGRTSRTGLLLHAGEQTTWLAKGILAVPWWRVI